MSKMLLFFMSRQLWRLMLRTNESLDLQRLLLGSKFFFCRLDLAITNDKHSQILRILRKIRPNQKIIEDYADDNIVDISTVSNELSVELLARFGRKGWTSIETSIENNVQGL